MKRKYTVRASTCLQGKPRPIQKGTPLEVDEGAILNGRTFALATGISGMDLFVAVASCGQANFATPRRPDGFRAEFRFVEPGILLGIIGYLDPERGPLDEDDDTEAFVATADPGQP